MSHKPEPVHQILIADDEKALRQGLSFLITRHYNEVTVFEASNGQECWDILETEPGIRLVFVDIRMPGRDGLQICAKMKAAALPARAVIISGFRDFEYARQALRFAVSDYLLKPINPSDVLRLVQEVILVAPPVLETPEKQERLLIEQIRVWIHDHLHEDITLQALSHKFHYSLSYVSTLFKKETGQGFQEYLADCRLQRAKHLLLDPSLRVSSIAEQVGYTNAKAFAIAFRKSCGITPTEYREKRRADQSL